VSIADAASPVPPLVEVMLSVMLFFAPAVVPVTFTENVQPVLVESVAPDRLSAPDPALAVIVPPPQEPMSPLGVEITSPDGNVSLNVIPARDVAFPAGLVTVN
jgi:hypothetical protein